MYLANNTHGTSSQIQPENVWTLKVHIANFSYILSHFDAQIMFPNRHISSFSCHTSFGVWSITNTTEADDMPGFQWFSANINP